MYVKERDYPLFGQVQAKQDVGGGKEGNDNSLVVEQSAEAAK